MRFGKESDAALPLQRADVDLRVSGTPHLAVSRCGASSASSPFLKHTVVSYARQADGPFTSLPVGI
jgi:hypothetical protein